MRVERYSRKRWHREKWEVYADLVACAATGLMAGAILLALIWI